MNEDLHDIDDLFRDGIEEYREAVPPAVWEAVDKALDKKQASLYKNKYNRLKRVALLLLCFSGGVYVIINAIKDRQTNLAKQKAVPEDLALRHANEYTLQNTKPSINDASSMADSAVTNTSKGNSYPDSNPDSYREEMVETKSLLSKNAITANGAKKASNNAKAEKATLVANQTLSAPLAANRSKTGNAIFIKSASPAIPGSYISQKNKNIAKGGVQKNKPITNADVALAVYNSSNSINSADSKADIAKQAQLHEPVNIHIYTPLQPLPLQFSSSNLVEYSTPKTNFIKLSVHHIGTPAKANAISVKKSKTRMAHEYSLTAFAAPNFSFDRLEDDHNFARPGRDREEAHRKEQDDISLSTGLLFNYGLTKNLRLQSGVGISYSSKAIGPKTIFAKANNGQINYELNSSSGNAYIEPKNCTPVVVGDSANALGTTSQLTYLGIPVSVSYRIGIGRFAFLPSVGAGFNVLLSGTTKTNLYNTSGNQNASTPIIGLKPTYIDAQLGLGIEYGINRKLSIAMHPNARLALMPINKETPVKSYQNFLSVETGVKMKL